MFNQFQKNNWKNKKLITTIMQEKILTILMNNII